MKKLMLLFLLPMLCLAQPAKKNKRKDYLVTLTTDFGVMNILLYDQTPLHKANFIKLVERKFYDSLLFHRVIQSFMIQGGDPNSRQAPAGMQLGNGDVGYTIPAEFVPALFHKKGALAAARDNNPAKASSGCQFYIVEGRVWDDAGLATQLERIKSLNGRLPTDEQKQVYKTLGGTPHLDGNYTVFGEVLNPPVLKKKKVSADTPANPIMGIAVVDSIANRPRNPANRPLQDVRMTVTGRWEKKKRITKQFGYTYL